MASSYEGAQAMYAKLKAQADATATAAGAAEGGLESTPAPAALVGPRALPALTKPVVVLFGGTHYEQMGKKAGGETAEAPNLWGPHRLLAGFGDVRVAVVATGSTSAHVVAIGGGGEVFSWGRNECGQLGLGDTVLRPGPTRVKGLDGRKIASASTGKAHTLFRSGAGLVLAAGAVKQGAVGLASKKLEAQVTPTAVSGLPEVAEVASGANFNLACDKDGDVWAWGWSEFGVLGNGTDGQHNTRDGAVKLSYIAQMEPQRILKLVGKQVRRVACGAHHCAAITSAGVVYTWGCGDYGRLGHKEQKDLWVPTELSECRGEEVSCGAVHSAAMGWPVLRNGVVCTGAPTVYMWGRVKSASQNAWMYPKPEDDLRGWNVKAMACGASHNVVHADSSVIAWGPGCANGELGFGVGGKKSSARPEKVEALEGVTVAQVTCGLANTVLLVEASDTVDKLPEWTPAAPAPAAEAKGKGKGKQPAAAGKRKAPEPAAKGKKAKK